MKWNEGRRLRVVESHPHVREAGVSARANYVALPSMAGRGQDEGGESRWIGGGNARPVPEARSPCRKSPRVERREAMRFLFAEEAKHHPLRLAALHLPSSIRGDISEDPLRSPREAAGARLYGSGCLKIESGK